MPLSDRGAKHLGKGNEGSVSPHFAAIKKNRFRICGAPFRDK
jgi:hypothetical protein